MKIWVLILFSFVFLFPTYDIVQSNMDLHGLEEDELYEIEQIYDNILDHQVKNSLLEMAKRELEMIKHEKIREDPELKNATIWNFIVLKKAYEMINLNQKEKPKTQTSPD